MSRGKKLLILLAVLAVCIGAYAAVSHFFGGDSSPDSVIKISDTDTSSIESVRWIFDGTELEIKPLDEKTWYCVQDDDFPLDQDTAIEMLNAVSDIRAVRMIAEEPDELSKYGMNEPSVRVYVTVDGTVTEYDIGNYNESSGYYYMMYTDDPALYYVDSSLYNMFSVGLLDIVEYEYLPEIEISDAASLTIENKNTSANITYYPDGIEAESELHFYLDGASSPVDVETAEKLIDGFVNITWDSCVSYNVGDEELAKYGLDKPTASFSIKYKVESDEEESEPGSNVSYRFDTLLIGNAAETTDGKNAYYAMIKGGKCVYMISADTAEQYLNFMN